MKARVVALCCLVFFYSALLAQEHSTMPAITTGEWLADKGIYRFPEFTPATVVFRNGLIAAEHMNYNISLDEMHFINAQGDTLSIANPGTIHFISLNGSKFYYDKGWLQAISTTAGLILAFRQTLTAEKHLKSGYGVTSSGNHTESYSFFKGNGQQYTLANDDQVSLAGREIYFLGDGAGHFSKATREFILQHFKEHQPKIRSFLKTSHINFNKLEDLLQLLEYCSTLKVP